VGQRGSKRGTKHVVFALPVSTVTVLWDYFESHWMRSNRVVRAFDWAKAEVLGLIPASSDTVESEGRQRNQC
jgi:hypothetical protein